MTTRLRVAAAVVGAALAVVAWLALAGGTKLPPGLTGAIVLVSDRDGTPALY
jgi:hypothetical protein